MELEELDRLLDSVVRTTRIQYHQPPMPSRSKSGVFKDLKTRFKWTLVIFSLCTLCFSPYIIGIGAKRNTPLFLILYSILAVESVISLIAIVQINILEERSVNVKAALIKSIRGLRTIFQSYIYLNAGLYILFIILIEFYHNATGFDTLAGLDSIPIAIRFIFYICFVSFQLFQKNRAYKKHYGERLEMTLILLHQTQEE